MRPGLSVNNLESYKSGGNLLCTPSTETSLSRCLDYSLRWLVLVNCHMWWVPRCPSRACDQLIVAHPPSPSLGRRTSYVLLFIISSLYILLWRYNLLQSLQCSLTYHFRPIQKLNVNGLARFAVLFPPLSILIRPPSVLIQDQVIKRL